jgi:hypothetical protein
MWPALGARPCVPRAGRDRELLRRRRDAQAKVPRQAKEGRSACGGSEKSRSAGGLHCGVQGGCAAADPVAGCHDLAVRYCRESVSSSASKSSRSCRSNAVNCECSPLQRSSSAVAAGPYRRRADGRPRTRTRRSASALRRGIGPWGFDLAGVDPKGGARRQFLYYANGAWEAHTAIPADKTHFKHVRHANATARRTTFAQSSRRRASGAGVFAPGGQIGALYNSWMKRGPRRRRSREL